MVALLITSPTAAMPRNRRYWPVMSGFSFWNVQMRLRMKFEVEAQRNPSELATYLFSFSHSLQR